MMKRDVKNTVHELYERDKFSLWNPIRCTIFSPILQLQRETKRRSGTN